MDWLSRQKTLKYTWAHVCVTLYWMGPTTHQSNASSSYPHIKMSSKKPFEQDVILYIICKQDNRFQEESLSHCLHIQEKYWDMECWNVDRLTNWHAQACSSQKRTSETNQKNRNITYGDVKLARGVNFNNVGLLLCKKIFYIYFICFSMTAYGLMQTGSVSTDHSTKFEQPKMPWRFSCTINKLVLCKRTDVYKGKILVAPAMLGSKAIIYNNKN